MSEGSKFSVRYRNSTARYTVCVGKRRFVVRDVSISVPVTGEYGTLRGTGFITIFPNERLEKWHGVPGRRAVIGECHCSHYDDKNPEIHL